MVGVKRCSRCGQDRPVLEFNVRTAGKDGRQAWCRQCFRRYWADYCREADR